MLMWNKIVSEDAPELEGSIPALIQEVKESAGK